MVGLFLIAAPLSAQQLGGAGLGLSAGTGSLGSESGQLSQRLGISEEQLQQLRDQAAQGGVENSDLEQLCASIAAKHLSADQAGSMGRALGLSGEAVSSLVKCADHASNQMGSQGGAMGPAFRAMPSGTSSIEARFRELDTPYQLLAPPSLSRLDQFGYDFFSGHVAGSASFDSMPVSSNYIVGVGDELNVLLWGRFNRTLKLTVQRDGTLLVPQIGPLPVAGLSFAQTQKLIVSQINQIEGVQSDVTMGRLRTIQVFTIGQVAQPGLQSVSALARVSDALLAAGGVRKAGSLRRVELRRDNRVIRIVDLYAMLLNGDTSADLRLEPRDVVFVPVIGPVVGIAGDVKNPAIYELRGAEALPDVIRKAGGVSAFGYAHRIQVERIENHERRVALDVRYDTFQARRFAVNDGDLIKVFTVLPEQADVVKLEGNVNRPGTYQWTESMRVVDLLRQGQGVRERTFFDYALLKRRDGRTRVFHSLPINLGQALSDETSAADLTLFSGDTLTVYSAGEINEIPTVTVRGSVRKPGTYPLSDGMTVSDLLYAAGGLKKDAFLRNAQLAQTEVVNGAVTRHSYRAVNLEGALNGTPVDNLLLHGGEELVVAQASDWHRPWVVQIQGEAMRPGPYIISEGERLFSVLQQCGGVREDGYLPGLMLIRESLKRLQHQNIELARTRLSGEIARVALMPNSSSNSQQQPSLTEKATALRMLQDMITQSAQQQAIGRIVVNVQSVESIAGTTSDLQLEDGDQIIIPKEPSFVNVMGEVYGPSGIAYDPAATVAQYIDRAGGLTQEAEKDQVFVVKANGEIVSEEGFKHSNKNRIFPLLPLTSGGLMATRLEPGDTIYIPAKVLYIDPIKKTLDVTQIVANSAQAIAYAALLGTLL